MSNKKNRKNNDDLFPENISSIFKEAKPDPDEIPGAVDGIVLEHIKYRSREIRRDRNVALFFPRWKEFAVAGMAVLVCAASFNLFFRSEVSDKHAMDFDGNGRVNIIDAYLMDRRLMDGDVMPTDLDLNEDGAIDHADIKIIANSSVSLMESEA